MDPNDENHRIQNAGPDEEYIVCKYDKCRKRDLISNFYGSKRFCTHDCAAAYSFSIHSKTTEKTVKKKRKVKEGKRCEPQSGVRRSQRIRRTAADSQQEAEQTETTTEKSVI